MRKITEWTVLAVVILFLAVACAPSFNLTLGEIPAADPATNIKPGETTRGEVQGLFGPPDMEGVNDDGRPTWTYTRMSIEVEKASDARMTEFFNLTVSFDGDVVNSYSYDRKAK